MTIGQWLQQQRLGALYGEKHLMLRVTDIGYSQIPAMNTAATYHICIERALRQGWASAVVSPAESQPPRKTSCV